ncbi:hypothetical protein AMECASPLE_035305 [Ameca splendens]|uniref:Uncharacterized protein n=1 Tax=Ameca splendens TaxID=208324 RepID=A0ABV1A2Q7_9TELE
MRRSRDQVRWGKVVDGLECNEEQLKFSSGVAAGRRRLGDDTGGKVLNHLTFMEEERITTVKMGGDQVMNEDRSGAEAEGGTEPVYGTKVEISRLDKRWMS